MQKPVEIYISRNREALHMNNPCLWPAYSVDPENVWKYIAHLIGYGLRAYPAKDVKRAMGSLYGLVPMCCIRVGYPVLFDAHQFLKWVKERYEPLIGN
jgi:hypothetical protein